MQRVKIAAPQGKVKGVTFNKTTGGFRCPPPGGYQREHSKLFGVGTNAPRYLEGPKLYND